MTQLNKTALRLGYAYAFLTPFIFVGALMLIGWLMK